MIRFVIFAAPRTGSNLLCSLLNGHPDIVCHHGLFNPGGIHTARDSACDLGTIEARDRDPDAFLRRVWTSAGGVRAVGFKMNRDESEAAAAALLEDRSVRKVLLRRRNRVRTYVSEEIARRTGVWESYEPAAAVASSIRVERDDLVRHCDLNDAYYAHIEGVLRATRQDRLEIFYEDLAEPREVARLFSALGVAPHATLTAACHKVGPQDLHAVVENLDELAAALRGTDLLDDLYGRDAPDLRVHVV